MLTKFLQKTFIFIMILPLQIWGGSLAQSPSKSSVFLSEGYLEILAQFLKKNSYFTVTLIEKNFYGGNLFSLEFSQEAKDIFEKSADSHLAYIIGVDEFSINTEHTIWQYLSIIFNEHKDNDHWGTMDNPNFKPDFIKRIEKVLIKEEISNPLRIIHFINSEKLSSFLGYRTGKNNLGYLKVTAPDADALSNNLRRLNKHITLSQFKLPLSVYASRGKLSSEECITRFVRDRQIPLAPINRKSKFLHDQTHIPSLLMITQRLFKSYQKLGRSVLLFSRYLDEKIISYMKLGEENKYTILKEIKQHLLRKVVVQIDLLGNVPRLSLQHTTAELETKRDLDNMTNPMVENKLAEIIHNIVWKYLNQFPNIDEIEKGFFKRYPKLLNYSFLPKGITHLGQLLIESRQQLEYLRQLELPTN